MSEALSEKNLGQEGENIVQQQFKNKERNHEWKGEPVEAVSQAINRTEVTWERK